VRLLRTIVDGIGLAAVGWLLACLLLLSAPAQAGVPTPWGYRVNWLNLRKAVLGYGDLPRFDREVLVNTAAGEMRARVWFDERRWISQATARQLVRERLVAGRSTPGFLRGEAMGFAEANHPWTRWPY
jgi:hypothetical protein